MKKGERMQKILKTCAVTVMAAGLVCLSMSVGTKAEDYPEVDASDIEYDYPEYEYPEYEYPEVDPEFQGLDAAELQRKYPQGAYWNHVVQAGHDLSNFEDLGPCNNPDGYTWHACNVHFGNPKVGWYDCNSFMSIQCYGFAAKLTYDVYGSNYYEWPSFGAMSVDDIKPGDVIFFRGAGSGEYGHRAMILDKFGSEICVGECNWGRRCYINWGRWFDVNTTSWYMVFSAPYELPGGGKNAVIYFRKGDMDGNKVRNLKDAQLALKAALRIGTFSDEDLCRADMDGDGNVSLKDAQFLLKVALKIEWIY